jgi:hypothetical protein
LWPGVRPFTRSLLGACREPSPSGTCPDLDRHQQGEQVLSTAGWSGGQSRLSKHLPAPGASPPRVGRRPDITLCPGSRVGPRSSRPPSPPQHPLRPTPPLRCDGDDLEYDAHRCPHPPPQATWTYGVSWARLQYRAWRAVPDHASGPPPDQKGFRQWGACRFVATLIRPAVRDPARPRFHHRVGVVRTGDQSCRTPGGHLTC